MTTRPDPVQPADDDARDLSRHLLSLSHAALSYLDAETGAPAISRISFGRAPDGGFLTLMSALAPHHAGLLAQPACAVLLGEPGTKGDPLTHPRLMMTARARHVAPDTDERSHLRTAWLAQHPKAKLYVDFTDFSFFRLLPMRAMLNAGFARAFRLEPQDLM
jgi:hypothetical protein